MPSSAGYSPKRQHCRNGGNLFPSILSLKIPALGAGRIATLPVNVLFDWQKAPKTKCTVKIAGVSLTPAERIRKDYAFRTFVPGAVVALNALSAILTVHSCSRSGAGWALQEPAGRSLRRLRPELFLQSQFAESPQAAPRAIPPVSVCRVSAGCGPSYSSSLSLQSLAGCGPSL